MNSVSKERRAELRDDIHDSIEAAFLGGDEAVDGELAELSLYELRALLDMADERDRYRAALEEIAGMHGCCQTEGCSTEYPMCDTMIAHAALEGEE